MNTNDFSPNAIRDNLSDVLPLVYEGLDLGCSYTREYFNEILKRDINKPLAANIARFHALEYVKTKKSLNSFYLENLLNNGIGVKTEWCQIRTLKMYNGETPTATHSKKSQLFYGQDLPSQQNRAPRLSGIDWDKFIQNSL